MNRKIKLTNKLIRDIASQYKLPLIDTHRYFRNCHTSHGLHLSRMGKLTLAKELINIIEGFEACSGPFDMNSYITLDVTYPEDCETEDTKILIHSSGDGYDSLCCASTQLDVSGVDDNRGCESDDLPGDCLVSSDTTDFFGFSSPNKDDVKLYKDFLEKMVNLGVTG